MEGERRAVADIGAGCGGVLVVYSYKNKTI